MEGFLFKNISHTTGAEEPQFCQPTSYYILISSLFKKNPPFDATQNIHATPFPRWPLFFQEAATDCVTDSPVTGAGHQHAQKVVDDEGEDDSGDGSAGDGVAGILQFACEGERVTTCSCEWDARSHRRPPDMLEPAMIPVQPLNMTAKTVAKLIIVPVV